MDNPFFFMLGCQRSGTTLLKHIVDIHPQVAVMPESGWFGTWYELGTGLTPEGFVTPELIPKLLLTCKNVELGMNPGELYEMAGRKEKVLYASFVSTIFDRYGKAHGKSLVGSKNPDYLRHLNTLHRLWPQAKFVHIIRDGRDICLSMSDRWKNRGDFRGFPFLLYEKPDQVFDDWSEDPAITTAKSWEWNVQLGREFGRSLNSEMYYEMRYEDLVARPEAQCIALCEFLGIPFDSAMLRHQEIFKPRRGESGAILHKSVGLPITPGLRNWRSEMAPGELERFEAAVGPFLEELGYSRGAERVQVESLEQAARISGLFEERVRGYHNGGPCSPAPVDTSRGDDVAPGRGGTTMDPNRYYSGEAHE
jgi:hypothetical protein